MIERKVTLHVSKVKTKDNKTYLKIFCRQHDNDIEWIELSENYLVDNFIMLSVQQKIKLALFALMGYNTKSGPIDYKIFFDKEYSIKGVIYGFPGDHKKGVDFAMPLTHEEIEFFMPILCEMSDQTY